MGEPHFRLGMHLPNADVLVPERRVEASRCQMDPEVAAGVAIWAIPFGIVGACVYHVVTDFELYREHLERGFDIAAGGLGLPGVILGGALEQRSAPAGRACTGW